MGRGELPGHLVCPRNLDVGQLEGHLRWQGLHCSEEGVRRLKSRHVHAIETLTGRRLVHLGDVRRDILEQHAPPVRHLHIRTTTQRTQECCDVSPQASGTVLFSVVEAKISGAVLAVLKVIGAFKDCET